MTEIEELFFSSAMLDMSGQLPMVVSPGKPTSMAPDVPTASGEETPSKPGKINLASLKEMPLSPQESSQAGTTNDTVPHKPLTFFISPTRDP